MSSRSIPEQMIEYLDSVAHLLEMDAYQALTGTTPDWGKYDYCMFKATSLSNSAAYFRREDPDLPPPRKRPHPSSYFEGGADARKLVDNRTRKR